GDRRRCPGVHAAEGHVRLARLHDHGSPLGAPRRGAAARGVDPGAGLVRRLLAEATPRRADGGHLLVLRRRRPARDLRQPLPNAPDLTMARPLLMWYGFLGGAAAWALQLVLGYGIKDSACSQGSSDTKSWIVLVAGLLAAGALR